MAKSLSLFVFVIALLVTLSTAEITSAQMLEAELLRVPTRELAAQAKAEGDAVRGAIVFFQPHMACAKCHAVGPANQNGLGPDLAALGKDVSDDALVESVLTPSKVIRKGFESVTVLTVAGQSIAGILVERTKAKVVLRELTRGGETTTIVAADIEEVKNNDLSLMPAGQVNQLNSRQQFLDLIRYLCEIRDGGAARAAQLQPAASLLTFTVPAYEQQLDHAGLIGGWNAESLKRGEAIYRRVCGNCHGTKDQPGSLPTSLRFAEGKFKNGSDPLSMYRTLTYGFGLMTPQAWMVPSQKYDAIHYIRETYLRPHNPSQFVAVDAAYLAKLPKGNTRGPAPSKIEPWSAMDYGPGLAHTYEIPGEQHNFAYKGIAIRLDPGAGGVSRGRNWLVFDTDTLRVAAAWQGTGKADDNFIDWQGIQFNGAHGVHPRIVGDVAFTNATGPGWADSKTGQFRDDQRVLGRDGRRYGPLPRDWGRFRGQYQHGQQIVLSYSIGQTDVLESPSLLTREGEPTLVLRTFNIGPRERDLVLQVAEHTSKSAQLSLTNPRNSVALLATTPNVKPEAKEEPIAFDGNTYLEVPADKFDVTNKDFTIAARIKTKADGTIGSISAGGAKWTPNGQTFFIRNGRLGYDIGWVGAVTAKTKVNDGEWHHVTMTWEAAKERVRLYVDGRLDGEGPLAAKAALPKGLLRIGFTAPDFPSKSFFNGEISEVRFYQQRLAEGFKAFEPMPEDKTLIARWVLQGSDSRTGGPTYVVRRGTASPRTEASPLLAGFAPQSTPAEWLASEGKLRLKIPAGKEPLRFTIWQPVSARHESRPPATIPHADRDLHAFTRGGPPRWPQKLTTPLVAGPAQGPFAIDLLTAPDSNPWLAQTRFTGLDFFPDGRLAVCSWDGDVWLITPQESESKPSLTWQRIATGLFQPLGLKIIGGKIHITCRDQLAVLHDLNDDGETDFYECLNNDHQVTEHFHEFAMGLQTDAAGNFYYAKSGCHGKAAVVPHHGTLLRVSPDGSRTDILATGFRAANGVCLNPDGSFVVTDQEGFWNPKNRINWVTVDPIGDPSAKPKFYGNMLGYHDVTDSSDAAMEPPLCWITNAFDRSPAELLWVESKRWGPLNGSLLNLSYGYGKVFLVPHEKVRGPKQEDQMQGGLIELPLPAFPTGVMRGRFNSNDGHLYLCGMFAWAGSATQPGGLYRLRATGQPVHMPIQLQAKKTGLELIFTDPLDPASLDIKNLQIKIWSLKRTANYGSKHYDEQPLAISSLKLSMDGKTLSIHSADLRPTWCMEIKYTLRSAQGTPVVGTIHNTIHTLAD